MTVAQVRPLPELTTANLAALGVTGGPHGVLQGDRRVRAGREAYKVARVRLGEGGAILDESLEAHAWMIEEG